MYFHLPQYARTHTLRANETIKTEVTADLNEDHNRAAVAEESKLQQAYKLSTRSSDSNNNNSNSTDASKLQAFIKKQRKQADYILGF